MSNAGIQVLVTDRNLNAIGDPLTGWTRIDATLRWREPGSGTITLPARPETMELLAAGHRLEIIEDGRYLTGGPMERPMAPYQRSIPGDEGGGEAPPGTVEVAWADDLVHLEWRRVYPNPALPVDSQDVSHYEATGSAEQVMRQLVDLNAGPNALPGRQVPALALGDLAGVGTTISVRARYSSLLAELQSAAINGGELGFRLRRAGGQLLFEVYQPRDLTAEARYSWDLGNLRSITVEQASPSLTHAIVGGQGEGSFREIVEVADAVAASRWWRIESWVDSRHEDTYEGLVQSGHEALIEGGESVQVSAVTVDTPDLTFGRDVDLGDRVTIAYLPGVEVSQIVRQAHIQITPTAGTHTTVLIGSQQATTDPAWVQITRRIQRRLTALETGTDVPAPSS